ncbi:MAG: three-Cys-motif partner protein TcmP [Planctomycetes bacterium]|nr:three-Cys-motif partner protein TcmP [Planctomycetota bacterium]
MGNADKTHFDSYRLQTRTKHAILDGYLPAYFSIIKTWHKNLVFIDGFAGPGEYTSGRDSFDGSPIRAMKLVTSNKDLADRVLCLFIEKNKDYFDELVGRVDSFKGTHGMKKPIIVHGTFTSEIEELLKSVDDDKGLAPTFLFVDPCGVEDVSMTHIAAVLSRDYCEVFIFFNLDGIRRIAGLPAVSQTLVALYGSAERARAVVEAADKASGPQAREEVFVAHYKEALAEASGAKFFLPLRIEQEDRVTTSHYLIHATKHPLGFRIMKEVMWGAGGGIECEGDRLALLQASRKGGGRLFHPEVDELRRAILQDLKSGAQPVTRYLDEWVTRPEDMFCESIYRRELLQLEADGKIEVLANDGATPCPPQSRRPHKGKPTLAKAKGYFVRLPKG